MKYRMCLLRGLSKPTFLISLLLLVLVAQSSAGEYKLLPKGQSVRNWPSHQNYKAHFIEDVADNMRIIRIRGEYSRSFQSYRRGKKHSYTGVIGPGSNLSKSNLTSADLMYADMKNVNFSDAQITHINLEQANLRNADMTNVNAMKSRFFNAELEYADLTGADLRDADLFSANFARSNLSKANLSGNLPSIPHGPGTRAVNADFQGALLRSTNFTNVDLKRSNFSGADLSGADFRGATGWRSARWGNAWYEAGSSPTLPRGMNPKDFGIIERVLEERSWTDKTGEYTLRAAFLQCMRNKVILRKDDGTLTKYLTLDDLSEVDQRYIRSLMSMND